MARSVASLSLLLPMVESGPDQFRISSQYFSRIPWRTDVLLTPRGLDQLDSVPILQASEVSNDSLTLLSILQSYLSLIKEQERRFQLSVHFEGMQKVELLHSFCISGFIPNEGDTLIKELLKYRILDNFAHVYHISPKNTTRKKEAVPFVDKFVRPLMISYPIRVLKAQLRGMRRWETGPKSSMQQRQPCVPTTYCL